MRPFFCCILLVAGMLMAPVSKAQFFSPFILSGKADKLASGDLSFLTPDLQAGRLEASVSYGRWLPEQLPYGSVQAGGFLALQERFGVRLEYRNNAFTAFDAFDAQGNVAGTVKPSEQRILAGIALRLQENVFFDVNGKYLTSFVGPDSRTEAFAGDVSVSYSKEGLTLGVKGADLGSKYTMDRHSWALPMRVLAGGSYRRDIADKHSVTAGADIGYILPKEYGAFTAAAGAQYTYDGMFFARAGGHYSSAVAPRFVALGAGIAYQGIAIDAAYLFGPVCNAWTLSLRFTRQ